MLDDRTKEMLRRRAERPPIDDIERLYRTAAADGAKRRRRRRAATIAACVLLLVAGAAAVVANQSSSSPTRVDVPPAGHSQDAGALGLQFRPVLGSLPAGAQEDGSAASVVAGCDVDAVMELGARAPSSGRAQLGEGGCVIVSDTNGARVLLGPVALDGTSITNATKTQQPASGWGADLELSTLGLPAFNALANAQFHGQFGVVADGELVATPTVEPADATFTPYSRRVRISVGDERAADRIVRAVAAKPEPGTALAGTGPGDCSTTAKPGAEVTFATRVTGGHTICVTQEGNSLDYYLDGVKGGGATGVSAGFTTLGGLGTIDGRVVLFGNLPPNASTLRLTFCKGPPLLIRPLNGEQPRYVAATLDLQKYGLAFNQYADDEGRPLAPSPDPRATACERSGRTTTTN